MFSRASTNKNGEIEAEVIELTVPNRPLGYSDWSFIFNK
jgi:hypothetical protein